jgi:hypothetical protein
MKNTLKILYAAVLFAAIAILPTACIDYEYETPDYEFTDPDFDANISIADLKAMYPDSLMLIDTALVVEGTVIANGASGNYYKAIVIQDSTAGLEISIDAYELQNNYPIGQKILIKCEGLYLGEDGGVVKIGSDYEGSVGRLEEPLIKEYVYKKSGGQPIVPKVVSILNLIHEPANTLIKLEGVQFKSGELDRTFADAINLVESDVQLEDSFKNSVIIRTSGYADFAGDSIPEGSGSVIALNNRYYDTPQLAIRNLDEVQLDNSRFGAWYEKDFEDNNLYSDGWTTQVLIGDTDWEADEYGGNYFAAITNYDYNTGNSASEAWYISPAFDLSDLNNPRFSFDNAMNYNGPDMEVKISTNYDGFSDPNTADWTEFSPILSSGGFSWVNSGILDLNPYKESSVYIAFIYYGSDSNGATWEVDNILIDHDK